MRLIDADALSEELSTLTMAVIGLRAAKGVLFEFMKEYRNSVLRVVDEQSTIDPESLRPKWISVEDEPPKNSTYVNVVTDGVVAQAYWRNGKFYAFTAIGVATVTDVTHWMPLPEPPNCGVDMRKGEDDD